MSDDNYSFDQNPHKGNKGITRAIKASTRTAKVARIFSDKQTTIQTGKDHHRQDETQQRENAD